MRLIFVKKVETMGTHIKKKSHLFIVWCIINIVFYQIFFTVNFLGEIVNADELDLIHTRNTGESGEKEVIGVPSENKEYTEISQKDEEINNNINTALSENTGTIPAIDDVLSGSGNQLVIEDLSGSGDHTSTESIDIEFGTGDENSINDGTISQANEVLSQAGDEIPPETDETMNWGLDPMIKNQELGYIDGEVIVKLKDDTPITTSVFIESSEQTLVNEAHIEVTDIIKDEGIILISADTETGYLDRLVTNGDDMSTVELIEQYKNDPRVEYIQPNYIYYTQSLPNDTHFPNQWSLYSQNNTGAIRPDIHYREALDFIEENRMASTPTIVAVMDMGVAYDHPDLRSMMWDGSSCKSHTGTYLGGCIHGYDILNNDIDPRPSYGASDYHGTHVAGIIGAQSNNSRGIAGIGGNIQIMSLRVLGSQTLPYTTTLKLIDAINFAKYNNAKVINASIGGIMNPTHAEEIDLIMYNTIKSFPGLFIAAAGNNGIDTDTSYFYPAGFTKNITLPASSINQELVTIPGLDNIITVGASNTDDSRAYFSNFGKNSVDIQAPGVNIMSTIPTRRDLFLGNAGNLNLWQVFGSDIENWTTRIGEDGQVIGLNGTPMIWGDTRVPYRNNSTARLIKKIENTENLANVYVGFDVWCDTPTNQSYFTPREHIMFDYSYDGNNYFTGGYIYEGSPGSFLSINSYSGMTSAKQYSIHMGNNSTIFLRFSWITDSESEKDSLGKEYYGCGLGNIAISELDNGQSEAYSYLAGTSMAAPHVSGAAGLAWSYFPDKSYKEIRDAILAGGDNIASLQGFNRTGKRLNLSGMLHILQNGKTAQLDGINGAVTFSGSDALITHTTKDPIATTIVYSNSKQELLQNPYIQYAQRLQDNAMIASFSSDSLRTSLTRGEFIVLLAKILGISPRNCVGNVFSDVSNLDPSCGYIEAMVSANLLKKNLRYFSPNNNITRIEAISMISYSLKLNTGNNLVHHSDTSYLGGEFLGYIYSLARRGCIPSGGNLTPLSVIHTGEAYKLLVCAKYETLSPAGSHFDSPKTDHLYILSGLIPNQDYFYYIVSGNAEKSNPQDTQLGTFFLPYVITNSFSGNITSKRYIDISLSGSTISFAQNNSGMIYLSEDNKSSISISLSGISLGGSTSWKGRIYAPKLQSLDEVIIASGGSIQANFLYKMNGESGESIKISAGGALARLETGSGYENIEFEVLSSPGGGSPYSTIGSCVSKNSICEIRLYELGEVALRLRASSSPVPVVRLPSCSLSITPEATINGSGAYLTWNIINSMSGLLNPGTLILGSSGSLLVTPEANSQTTYTLSIINTSGTGSCQVSIKTIPATTNPIQGNVPRGAASTPPQIQYPNPINSTSPQIQGSNISGQKSEVNKDSIENIYNFILSSDFDKESIPFIISGINDTIKSNSEDGDTDLDSIIKNLYFIRNTTPKEKKRYINAIISGVKKKNSSKKTVFKNLTVKKSEQKTLLSSISEVKSSINVPKYGYMHIERVISLRANTMTEGDENIIFYLKKNDRIEILERFGEWSEVRYGDVRGYIKN